MRRKTPARALNLNRKTIAKHYHCRDNDAGIRMPKERQIGHATPVRAIVSASRGLPVPPVPRGVVEAVVSTAWCLGARRDESRYTDWGARARSRALPPEDRCYGAMRSVSVSV